MGEGRSDEVTLRDERSTQHSLIVKSHVWCVFLSDCLYSFQCEDGRQFPRQRLGQPAGQHAGRLAEQRAGRGEPRLQERLRRAGAHHQGVPGEAERQHQGGEGEGDQVCWGAGGGIQLQGGESVRVHQLLLPHPAHPGHDGQQEGDTERSDGATHH